MPQCHKHLALNGEKPKQGLQKHTLEIYIYDFHQKNESELVIVSSCKKLKINNL